MRATTEPAGAGPVDTLVAMPWSWPQAQALASRLGVPALVVDCHRFPDGETRVLVPPQARGRVALFATLDDPDAKLVALLLAARTLRDLGARELVLVAPYLCYMRQDIAFRPGEAVSQRIVGRLLAEFFDAAVTVDPHLHRVSTLAEAVPARVAIALSAAPALGDLAARTYGAAAPGARGPLLVGPDEESGQWVAAAAAAAGFEHAVCTKTRRGDRSVEIALPRLDVAGRAVLLVDDVASTGRTLVEAARALRTAGAASVDVAVTHALFVDDALAELRAAGVGQVWSTDAVAHPTNAIALAPLLADALR